MSRAMSMGEYLAGALFFAATIGVVALGAALIVRRRLPGLAGAPRVLALGLVATLGVLAVHVLPAAVWALRRETVLAAALIWLAAAARLRPVRPGPGAPPSGGEQPAASEGSAAAGRGPGSWAMAGAGVGMLALYGLAVARTRLTEATTAVDTLNFHLPGVARWIETGTIWQIDEFIPDLYFGNYPNNGDVMLLGAMLPWNNDFLAQFAMYPFFALTVVAVYAIGRELGAPCPASLLMGAVVGAIPVVLVPALVSALVDALMLAGFGTGILFLLRHRRTRATSDLVLAGLGLGVAFGTKWYGVTTVAAVLLTWAVGSLAAGRSTRTVARQGGALAGLIALAGGVWLVRNLILSGNPVFPVKVAAFGVTIFDAPRDHLREIGGFSLSDYAGRPDVWEEYLLPQFRDFVAGPGGYLALALVVTAVVLALRRRRVPGWELAAAGAGCTVLILLAYALTPYSALGPEGQPVLAGVNTRYGIPGLLIVAALAAWAVGSLRSRWLALALQALAVVAIADGLRVDGFDPSTAGWTTAAAAGALVAAGLVVHRRWRWRPPARGRPAAVVGVPLALLAIVFAGNEVQQRFNERRYLGHDAAVDWILAKAGSGHRIGLAGVWSDGGVSPVFPSFGPRLENEVVYVGRFVDELLRRYTTRDDFVAALRRERYDYLVVGRGRPPKPIVPEERWALSAGWSAVVRSDRLALYRSPHERPGSSGAAAAAGGP